MGFRDYLLVFVAAFSTIRCDFMKASCEPIATTTTLNNADEIADLVILDENCKRRGLIYHDVREYISREEYLKKHQGEPKLEEDLKNFDFRVKHAIFPGKKFSEEGNIGFVYDIMGPNLCESIPEKCRCKGLF